MKLKSKWPVRRFFAFLGALYLFCAVTPLLFAENGTAKSESVFRIYDTATETVRTVNDLDFLCGALPCEMAVSAPDEALKAQIIAIHTLYDRKRRENTGKDFDFTCDSAEKSIYTTDAGLTDEEQNRVRALCLSVLDKEIYFENEPINACYFAISGKKLPVPHRCGVPERPFGAGVSERGNVYGRRDTSRFLGNFI